MHQKQIRSFQKTVYDFYALNKRSFPWRKTKDPYHILVSEIMLQQTQTDRVVPKYTQFLEAFPTIESLAHAPLKKVLQRWQGLGYNRRGLMLHKAAQVVVKDYTGVIPTDKDALMKLPGIGPYTSGAVMAFAYNKPIVMIETNIRTVFIHHFFREHGAVHDKELLPLIEATLDTSNPRKWYSALMDYGAHLKKTHANPNRKSVHHTKQSLFKGSDREIRRAIIRTLTEKSMSKQDLFKTLVSYTISSDRFEKILTKLIKEGMLTHTKNRLRLS